MIEDGRLKGWDGMGLCIMVIWLGLVSSCFFGFDQYIIYVIWCLVYICCLGLWCISFGVCGMVDIYHGEMHVVSIALTCTA